MLMSNNIREENIEEELKSLLQKEFLTPLLVTKEKYDYLVAIVKKLAQAYYDENRNLVEDNLYDQAINELRKIEEIHPEWQDKMSPTRIIYATANSSFAKVKHKVPLLSLQDVFSYEQVEEFIGKQKDASYLLEEKIDGLSIAVCYEYGRYVRAITRGTGTIGEDVTENARYINSLPKTINCNWPYLEVRGEVYMPKSAFFKLNERIQQEKDRGKKVELFANPRNAASGSLRQKEAALTAERGLDVLFFEVQSWSLPKDVQQSCNLTVEEVDQMTHQEWFLLLKKFGLPLVYQSEELSSFEQVIAEIEKLKERRADLTYDIDGAVIKINSLALRRELGATIKYPRWAVAYKYPPLQKSTQLLDVIWQVGRTGKVTPLAILEPVNLAGSLVGRATLHNQAYLRQKDIRKGDYVFLQKAGDVIPSVDRVDLPKRKNNETQLVEIPNYCPSCDSKLSNKESEVALYCLNPTCSAKKQRYYEYVFGKSSLDLKGIGPSFIEVLLQERFVNNFPDWYYLSLKKEQLLKLHGFSDKKIDLLLNSLEASKYLPWEIWLTALSIDGIAKQNAKILAKKYPFWQELCQIETSELENIEGIGPILAQTISDFFTNPANQQLLQELAEAGIECLKNPQARTVLQEREPQDLKSKYLKLLSFQDEKLKYLIDGKRFCITGKFSFASRDEITDFLESYGGKFVSGVTAKIDLLLSGESSGSKYEKAKKLGIKILTEDDFKEMIN